MVQKETVYYGGLPITPAWAIVKIKTLSSKAYLEIGDDPTAIETAEAALKIIDENALFYSSCMA